MWGAAMAVRILGEFRTSRITKHLGRAFAAMALALVGAACSGEGSATLGVSSPTITYTGPSAWTITGPAGGPFANGSIDVQLQNNGADPIDWSASSIPSFVLLDQTSGTIAANSQTTVHAALDSALAATLAAGNNADVLAFHNDTAPQTDISINTTLSISAPGVSIFLGPATNFTTSGPAGGPFVPPSTIYSLTNTGSAALSWRVNAGASWVSASPSSGLLAPNATVDVAVSINAPATAPMSAGVYWSYIDFVDATTNTTVDTRNIGMTVTVGAPQVGWTVFTPSADTRTIYVSSSQGNDLNDGLSSLTPKRTINAAKFLLRNGFPDWLLLRCNDTWDESLGQWNGLSGRSPSERMLVGSYGTGARPLLRTGLNTGISLSTINNPSRYVAFVGIHCWANTYNGSNGTPNGIFVYERSQSILVEDCMFQGYIHGIIFESVGGSSLWHQDVQLRRNVVVDSYSTTSNFAAGAYLYRCNGLLLEENLFDRNGWNESVAGSNPSWFLHNVYVHNENTGVIVRGNLVAGCDGVQVRPGGTVEDNVFLRTAIALEFGLGTNPNVGGVSGVIRNNVVLDGGDIGSTGPSQGYRGWGILIGNVTSSTIENNIFCNNVSGHGPRLLSVEAANGWNGNTRGLENTTFQNNIVYNWGGALEIRGSSAQIVNFRIQNNTIQELQSPNRLIAHFDSTNTAGVRSSSNAFYSAPLSPSNWMQVGGGAMSVATWMTRVQDTTSVSQQAQYPAPSRTIATYHASIGGSASYQAFLTEARRQSKSFWRHEYTAAAVRSYIRAGFGL